MSLLKETGVSKVTVVQMQVGAGSRAAVALADDLCGHPPAKTCGHCANLTPFSLWGITDWEKLFQVRTLKKITNTVPSPLS